MDTKCSRSIPDNGNSQSRGPEAGSARGASRNSKETTLAGDKNLGGGTQDPGQGGKEMSLPLFFIYLCVYVCVLQRSFPSLSLIFSISFVSLFDRNVKFDIVRFISLSLVGLYLLLAPTVRSSIQSPVFSQFSYFSLIPCI